MDFNLAADAQEKLDQTPAVITSTGFDLKPVKKELASQDKLIAKMEKEAGTLAVTSRDTQARAIEIAGGAKTIHKNLKKALDTLTTPANDFLKQARNLFRPVLDRLEAVEKGLKDKAGAFEVSERLAQQKREAEAREEARKLQAKIDEEARAQREAAEAKAREAARLLKESEAAGTIDIYTREALEKTIEDETAAAQMEVPQVVIPVVTPQQTVTRTETGSGHMRMVWEIEVIDPAQVPRKYLTVDEKAIRADVKAGIREIPGVKIFEKPVMAIRT